MSTEPKGELVGITEAQLIAEVEGQFDQGMQILDQLGRLYWDSGGMPTLVALAAQRAFAWDVLAKWTLDAKALKEPETCCLLAYFFIDACAKLGVK